MDLENRIGTYLMIRTFFQVRLPSTGGLAANIPLQMKGYGGRLLFNCGALSLEGLSDALIA